MPHLKLPVRLLQRVDKPWKNFLFVFQAFRKLTAGLEYVAPGQLASIPQKYYRFGFCFPHPTYRINPTKKLLMVGNCLPHDNFTGFQTMLKVGSVLAEDSLHKFNKTTGGLELLASLQFTGVDPKKQHKLKIICL